MAQLVKRLFPVILVLICEIIVKTNGVGLFYCPSICTCNDQSKLVNCSNSDFRNFHGVLPSGTMSLLLDNNQLTEAPCKLLSPLKMLKVLSLSGNNIFAFGDNCSFLWSLPLDLFDLSYNRFRDIPVMSQRANFKVLNLAGNYIDSLKPLNECRYEFVQELILDNNKIKYIPSSFLSENSKLRILSAENNKIIDFGDDDNSGVFSSSIRRLSLGNNQIVRSENMWLFGAVSLEDLNLRGAYSRFAFARNLTAYGWELPGYSEKLRSLDLSQNKLFNLEEQCFSRCKNLRTLNLTNTSIDTFREGESQNLKELEELYLQSNFIRELKGNTFFGMKKLRELYVAFNKIANISKETFSSSQGLKNLRILNLSNNKLTNINFLQRAELPSLISLDISGNYLENVNVIYFGRLSKLQIIWLSNNTLQKIPDVSDITNLVELNLENNEITYVNYSVFKGATNLTTVLLNGNNVSKFDPFPERGFPGPVLFLDNNPIHCDCTESWFSNASAVYSTNKSLQLFENLRDAECILESTGSQVTLTTALESITCSSSIGLTLLVLAAILLIILGCAFIAVLMRMCRGSQNDGQAARSNSNSLNDSSEAKYKKGELHEIKKYKEPQNGKYNSQMVLRADKDQNLKDAMSLTSLKGSMVRLDKVNVKPFFEEIYV